MANSNTSYNNDKATPAVEFDQNNESPSGTFLHSDFKKHKDLKVMLDSNKDGLKLEAMKRIISMVANGRDASDLFPAVVKNVVSKNIEIKKLVYVYLVRYAEEQQDLALLSISTFQRALKDPNQLIRGSALRVLSSIRVPVIVPIMMLAIRDGVNDMSPYVRKTAAHAIPKLYSLDPEHRDELVSVVEKLLSDKSTLVMGSAVMAFEEVCPEKIELVHKNFRKLCNLLVDVEEWGQVIIINMLTRYARTQFVDPNAEEEGEEEDQTFYEEDEEKVSDAPARKPKVPMDPDHRLLLRNTKPLLQSRNTAVVMAVAQLYHHLAPRQEVPIAAKGLIRLLRSYREVQCVVLNTIAAMSQHRKGMFEPYLKSFFVRWSDVTLVKLLKLEILTTLASEVNISVILRELQTYIGSSDKEFVAATIQAIGRCASNIKEVTDTCLNGLVALLANRNESVVAESVVVIRKLLQLQPSQHRDIIKQLARLVDSITVPNARASILWLLGEYCERVPQLAPDVLRKMAKSFTNEEDIVKLQTLSLATKLYLTNGKQTKLLCQYIFNLAKYDQSYDIRDRARFLRHFIFPSPGSESEQLAKYAKKILLASKPAPVLASKFREQEPYQLGSLSHYINSPALGYQDLPEFPKVAPDPTVRNVETPFPWKEPKQKKKQVAKNEGYDEWRTSPVPGSDRSETSGSGEEESSAEETTSSDSEDDSSSGEDSSGSDVKPLENHIEKDKMSNLVDLSDSGHRTEGKRNYAYESDIREEDEEGTTSGDSSDMESSSSSSSVSSSDSEEDARPPLAGKADKSRPARSNVDLLMELDGFCGPQGLMPQPILTPTSGEQPPIEHQEDTGMTMEDNSVQTVGVVHTPVFQHLLLKSSFGGGLEVKCCFTRQPSLVSSSMIVMEWEFRNTSDDLIRDICLVRSSQPRNINLQYFDKIDFLPSRQSTRRNVEITVADSTQSVNLEVAVNERKVNITLDLPAGERVRPVKLPPGQFEASQAKLSGMNEQSGQVVGGRAAPSEVWEVLREHVNMFLDSRLAGDRLRLTGQMVATQALVLLTVAVSGTKHTVTVNCEDIIFGCMLLKQVQALLEASS